MKVLVADDDRVTRIILGRLLSGEFGCTVAEAADGTYAIEALASAAFDLLILDLQMPVMDGIDTLRALRECHGLQSLPVVVLTADRSEATVRQVAEFHVIDYLTKPLNPERLRERLHRVFACIGDGKTPGAPRPGNEPILDAASTVLVVDGDQAFRRVFMQAFGHRRTVLEAASGVHGLRLSVEAQPGAVFVGANLGVLTEPLLVKKLRSLPAVRDARLVAIVEPEADASARLANYDASMVRCDDPSRIAAQIDQMMRSGDAPAVTESPLVAEAPPPTSSVA